MLKTSIWAPHGNCPQTLSMFTSPLTLACSRYSLAVAASPNTSWFIYLAISMTPASLPSNCRLFPLCPWAFASCAARSSLWGPSPWSSVYASLFVYTLHRLSSSCTTSSHPSRSVLPKSLRGIFCLLSLLWKSFHGLVIQTHSNTAMPVPLLIVSLHCGWVKILIKKKNDWKKENFYFGSYFEDI